MRISDWSSDVCSSDLLRRCHQIIEREIAIRYRIERIGGRPVETERGGGRRAIDREARSGKRGGTQRAFVGPRARIGQAAANAREDRKSTRLNSRPYCASRMPASG